MLRWHWLKLELDKASTWLAPDGSEVAGDGSLDMARFSFTLRDNPHLGAAYLRALEAEYSGLWRRRFILGEWVIAEGSIYDMWDPEVHVVEPGAIPKPERLVALGVDYGTRHVFAAELLGVAKGKLWTLDEWRWSSKEQRQQLSSPEYLKRMTGWLGERAPEAVYVDPAAADFRAQMWQSGMPGVRLAENEVAPGIRTMAGLLAGRRMLVSRACEGLIETLPGYSWDEKAAARGEDKPVKEADDELDAWRYAGHSSRGTWEPELRGA